MIRYILHFDIFYFQKRSEFKTNIFEAIYFCFEQSVHFLRSFSSDTYQEGSSEWRAQKRPSIYRRSPAVIFFCSSSVYIFVLHLFLTFIVFFSNRVLVLFSPNLILSFIHSTFKSCLRDVGYIKTITIPLTNL